MRRHILLTAFLSGSALAQMAPAPDAPREAIDPRKNQKIEHIVTEDDANRIDELRVGGQAERIVVQPKNSPMPAYEIDPRNLARSRPDAREGFSNGQGKRVWNVMNF
jgi:hypothetical protein